MNLELPANTFPQPSTSEKVYEVIVKVSSEFSFGADTTINAKVQVTVLNSKISI